ncbi:MAG: bifunctional molybdenum cofactor biosynthesis protein MoaC/MoaB, partial [Deltaproteobacteria bacterium]|nr:bifunctional molybdenum cofactor biosynthesis protein MoaC/MoaB [Deltaproteobacteria bacterium]
MKDVSNKPTTFRTAIATSSVKMKPDTAKAVGEGRGPKGDPLPVARIAGIMAAKDATRLIPFCHPVRVDHADVVFDVGDQSVDITCTVTAVDRTGVEMEALTGASVAALTVYDMLKPVDGSLVIGETRLEKKKGGKSDFTETFPRPLKAAVLVVSDSTAAGKRMDTSGRAIQERLEAGGVEVVDRKVVPDEEDRVEAELRRCVADGLDLVVTTGGTGLGPRDVTVEAVSRVVERPVPGIAEAMRTHGFQRTPRATLSRSVAGVTGETLILTLPGSSRGASESLDAVFPGV